eukprot:Nitzschia sp. Nitz4//scaffold232_size35869//18431//20601//NITZ4_007807-RA/size35869-snap-gene-0.43-mRNA-1//1//CDS//3329543330//5193//frame0
MTRIIEKIQQRRQRRRNLHRESDQGQQDLPQGWYYSFEFFPPKTEAGLDNLLTRIDRMTRRLDPLFIDVTWGAGGSTSARTLAVASQAQRYFGVDVLLHLTTTGMTRQAISSVLEQAKACGIHNILALRGDPPRGKRTWVPNDVSGGDCDRAIDLVKLIRELHGDYFGIAVAGHPENHPSSTSLREEMNHLNEKVQAGADFIVTQFFYSVPAFVEYVKACRSNGIDCPIIPGIMPVQSYSTFLRMTQYCGVSVPQEILTRMGTVQSDDEAIKEIGCQLAAEMCTEILTHPELDIDGVHFYTLNLERSTTRILMQLGAIDIIGNDNNTNESSVTPTDTLTTSSSRTTLDDAADSLTDTVRPNSGRPLPWRPSAMAQRAKEEVRPINWANRPKSYVLRTEEWDEFPNGRWGDATSPAFGELSDLSHFYSFSLGSEEDRRAMLGREPKVPQDVFDVFASYVQGKIPHIPWCETPLQAESLVIQTELAELNRAGFLTINSQPAVNGAPSNDKVFGWGGSGGYVYQKEYCECFCSPERAKCLVEMVEKEPAMNLYAVNIRGDEMKVGLELGGVTALTWGVFPNREILQPTIFDPSAFLVWSEEAFSLWTSMWLNLYEFDTPSYELIEETRDSYYLVAIIDNDYIATNTKQSGGSRLWKAMLEAGTQCSNK